MSLDIDTDPFRDYDKMSIDLQVPYRDIIDRGDTHCLACPTSVFTVSGPTHDKINRVAERKTKDLVTISGV